MSQSPAATHSPRRRPLVAANWKMNLVRAEAASWVAAIAGAKSMAGWQDRAEVAVFPAAPLLATVAEAVGRYRLPVAWGGQDLHPEPGGAFTGDIAGRQLRDAGCTWVLCGHSERRRDHGESDEGVGRKVAAAARDGLAPLLCVGETREERRRGETEAVLSRQIAAGLEPVRTAWTSATPASASFAVAYEPVWAIGTGDTATPAQAQEAHAFLRRLLEDCLDRPLARATRLLYGGSVTPQNAAELIAGADIDGFLVGGASLDPERFLAIIGVCASASSGAA